MRLPPLAAVERVVLTRKPALTPGISLPESFPFDVYEKAEQPTPKRRKNGGAPPPSEIALHSSAHRSIDYSAREERFKSVDTLLNHFLAIIDPHSGEVEVVQAKKMVVRGTVRSKQAPPEAMEVGAGKPVCPGLHSSLWHVVGTNSFADVLGDEDAAWRGLRNEEI